MMKHLLTCIAFTAISMSVMAQNDTLLFENFDVDNTANYSLINNGNDTVWVNYDLDALPDANGRPQNWFWSSGAFATVDSTDACLFSSSWLSVLPPQVNRNWLITPPIEIVDANAVLTWYAAPRQTPLYVDGYTVLVSTTTNYEADFTDTLFQAAQYLSGSGNDWAAYTFSPGFVHGLDGTFIEYDGDSSRFVGVLRSFSASLAQFSGQTIYIAFLHDADDDNLIAVDDILVTGTLVGLAESPEQYQMTVFPNPATDRIELSYQLQVTSHVIADIYDVKGAKVLSLNRGIQIAGAQKLAIDVRSLPAGTYNVALTIAGSRVNSVFVKQ
jgi:hypothetical protein